MNISAPADDKAKFVVIDTLRVNCFAYQCCLLITLPSRQRVSSGKGFRCIGGNQFDDFNSAHP